MPTGRKTPGKLDQPPAPAEFDRIALERLSRLNVALFERSKFLPPITEASLVEAAVGWKRRAAIGTALIHVPAVLLRDHPLLNDALAELEVARIPCAS